MIRLVVIACIVSLAAAAEPPPVLSPQESLAAFELAEPGCKIELVASEPMVQDPVVIQFDGEGRLWVVEMRGYMQDLKRSGVKDPIGRVSVLEDVNGDGVMDKSTVFLDGLVLPRAIAIHPDGVLIAENEPLWFAQDTDGDLEADMKTLVDPDYAKDQIEHSSNGLLRAMDNWIYNAKEGHRYRRAGEKWIREETEERGQWGISQDDQGRLFYNYNHSQLHSDLAPPNTLTRNPNHEPSTGISVSVATTNAVFPVRPNLATNRGYIPGALDENGRIKEFTSACTPFIYREPLLHAFTGSAFIAETAGNIIKRSVLSGDGLRVTAMPTLPNRDFLASKDERFRPCWITAGPDGALYIADMYRGIVQDGPHMSPYLRQHSAERKMDTPIHLGRIWRIVPKDFQQPERPSFDKMNAGELVEHLAHSSGWWRDQAQMHLVERNLATAIPALREMALHHENPIARLHALWTLEGLRDPQPQDLTALLDAPQPFLQSAALRVVKSLGLPDKRLHALIAAKIDTTPAEQVRLQMLLTLGDLEIDDADRLDSLIRLVLPMVSDPLFRDAALSSLHGRELAFLHRLWPDADAKTPGMAFFIESISQAILQSRDAKAIAELLNFLDTPQSDWRQDALLSAIELHRAALIEAPVKLDAVPAAAKVHPNLRTLFAWPGHVPEPPAKAAVRPLKPEEQALFVRGRQIFLTSCFACHGADGKGMKFLAPPLAGSDWVNGSPRRLARVLFHGLTGPISVSGKRYDAPEVQSVMPPLAGLSNDDIAAVLTYIRRAWGNTAEPITPGDINRLRIDAQGRTMPWTEAELVPFAKEPDSKIIR